MSIKIDTCRKVKVESKVSKSMAIHVSLPLSFLDWSEIYIDEKYASHPIPKSQHLHDFLGISFFM